MAVPFISSLSLKTIYEICLSKGGYNIIPISNKWSSFQELIKLLNNMINIRNEQSDCYCDIRVSSCNCVERTRTCVSHLSQPYDFGFDLKSLFERSNLMTTCSCNQREQSYCDCVSRTSSICECQSRLASEMTHICACQIRDDCTCYIRDANAAPDYINDPCSCHQRVMTDCFCVDRKGNNPGEPYGEICYCKMRSNMGNTHTYVCYCQERATNICQCNQDIKNTCECEGRCICNTMAEY